MKKILMKGGEKEMEVFKETITRVAYKESCPICQKEIKGTSESQVKFNLEIHFKTQHENPSNKENEN